MLRRNTFILLGIAVLFALALTALSVKDIRLGGLDREGMKLGLDLRGGTQLVYEADLSGVDPGEQAARMDEAMYKIERRVDALGVAEPLLQRQGDRRIIVQLPGVRDIEEAVKIIGETARLEFKERTFDAQGNPVDTPLGLTGDDFKRAYVGNHPQLSTPSPVVNFEFKDRGATIFGEVTTRIAGTGNQVAVFLDEALVVSATAERPIPDGKAYIEGQFTLDRDWDYSRRMAIQLNAGALPVPLKIIQQESVDAFLGADSLHKSILAGMLGLGLVLVFMVLYYRVPGALAGVSLLVYAALVLAIFKLVPVTLSLAGIAAFILSVGMAVDANVLIFERTKEEAMSGRTLGSAVEAGFARAWPSIRDSNVSTFITCGILYWFGSSFGETRIMGFALTLFIGVAASMFTAIIVTRTFLRLAVGGRLARRLGLFVALPGPARGAG